jgi:hypothetical protein
VVNTTTEGIVFPNVTIPANYMQYGRWLRVRAFGRLSTTATPTITFRLRWGGVAGTVLAATPAITCGSTVTSACWSLELYVQCRSNGATGTLFCMGRASVNTASTPTTVDAVFGSAGWSIPAAATVDLTADTALSLTAQWGTANAANTLTGHLYTGEAGN